MVLGCSLHDPSESDMLCKSGKSFSYIYTAYNLHKDHVRHSLIYRRKINIYLSFDVCPVVNARKYPICRA